MNPERTIAIAMTRKFRKTMDDIFSPAPIDEAAIYEGIEKGINDTDFACQANFNMLPEHFKSMFKDIICKTKQDIIAKQKSTYDSMLTDVVSDAMYELEQYFKSNYSTEELEEIANFIESDSGKKMMSDMGSTNLLMKQQDRVRTALNEIVFEITSSNDLAKDLSDLIISMSFRDDKNQNEEDC